jgi:CheY-like chemotaxis protein
MKSIKDSVSRTKHWYHKRGVLKNVRVLVFDDDADNGELLRSMLLQESSASVTVTQSAGTALEMHRSAPYHAVIIGIQPGSWGAYDFLHAIRETDVEYRGFTPAIGVTGFPSPENEQRAITAGFNAYISIPLAALDLINAVNQVLHDSAKRAA